MYLWLARDLAYQVADKQERDKRLRAIDDLLEPPSSWRDEKGAPSWYGSDDDAWAAWEMASRI